MDKNYGVLLRLLARRIVVVFLVYQLCRLLFLWANAQHFHDVDAKAFAGGILFDLSAIGFINLLFIVLHLIPGNFKYRRNYQKILKVAFFSVNLLFIATNIIDLQYYKFTGRRSSFELITANGMHNEIGGLIGSFLIEFWYLPLGFVIASILIWKLLSAAPEFTLQKVKLRNLLVQTGALALACGIGLLMARGGFGKKPIRIVDAVNYSSIGNSALVLNTPYTILKSIGKKETLTDPKYFADNQLTSIFNPVIATNPTGKPQRKNVVILILESFGDENLRRGQTPFLDSLITQSYYFRNGFANGKVSIDAVPSLLSGIPSLMNSPVISSGYALNEVYGLPKILKKEGYETSFFHGAFNGSQNFDQYCKVAGFDRYFGKNEYDGPEAFDGKWGIFDEEFLQYFCRQIGTFKQPFFTSLFTISSHNPYTIPEKYKKKFPKGTTNIHESIAYTDFAPRQFFASAAKQSWYRNTIFVISADHTSAEPTEEKYTTAVGKFHIPILFFEPGNPEMKGISDKNFQQIDVLPSLVDYLNIDTKIVSFGKSFRSDKNYVVYYLDNVYHYVDGDFYMAFDGEKAIALYNFKTDQLLKNNLVAKDRQRVAQMERFIKAYIQSFDQRMIKNELTKT